VPADKATSKNRARKRATGRNEAPRARARLRAKRYETLRELREAVLAWCRDAVRRTNPSFDLPGFERRTREGVGAWGRGDPAFLLWRAVRDAARAAADYLAANPDAPKHSQYAAVLEAFLSAPCVGSDGALLPIGQRLCSWGTVRARPQGNQSARTRLVQTYGRLPNLLWWGNRKASLRDLAIVTLLGGCFPEAARRQQKDAVSVADRPTVLDVVTAEENTIRALWSRMGRG
jgi:hypothetical protein